MNIENFDVIVVGAGPSGISCALTIARKKNKVLIIEKASDFGVKNMFGGAIYIESLKELFPNGMEKVPLDRFLTKHNYVILNEENSISLQYENNENKCSATITRFNFDTFLAESARKEGVYFAPNTLVVDILKENGKIVGVKTENEEIKAKMVVLAEGFNSLLSEKIGLKKKTKPKSAILGIKETIKLPVDVIEKRFNLKDDNGAIYEFFCDLSKEGEDIPLSMGFLYTFKGSISIGVGVSMESLKKNKVKPYEYLERLKAKPFVASLISDGELLEYSAHSIPEGGYLELPKLYDDGVLMVGDCALLVDSIHFEGTNLAIKSGIIAGETCNLAIEKNDFSKKILKKYRQNLFKSFVVKDLATYKNLIPTLYKRRKSVFSYYPKKIDDFFNMWVSADNKGKKQNYKRFILSFLKDRNLFELLCDALSFVKCLWNAII